MLLAIRVVEKSENWLTAIDPACIRLALVPEFVCIVNVRVSEPSSTQLSVKEMSHMIWKKNNLARGNKRTLNPKEEIAASSEYNLAFVFWEGGGVGVISLV